MTDEERKKLIEDLLLMSDVKHYGPLYRRAADEIERLANELEEYRQMYLKWKKQAIGYTDPHAAEDVKNQALLALRSSPTSPDNNSRYSQADSSQEPCLPRSF